jgi:hypothetical protein
LASSTPPEAEAKAFVDVLWSGRALRPGWSGWRYYAVEVVGRGADEIAFYEGVRRLGCLFGV